MQIPDVPPQLLAALVEAAAGQRLALVGGVVRDLLLHRYHQDPWRGLPDLDLVVEGQAADLVARLPAALEHQFATSIPLRQQSHGRYGTVELELQLPPDLGGTWLVDLASARREMYPEPANNPIVSLGSIEQDLARRDFTVNSMALVLNQQIEEPIFVDPWSGQNDIQKRILRFLHLDSFFEDPTRLVRAAHYAARLDFKLDNASLAAVRDTLARWPWSWTLDDNDGKAPSGFGTRLSKEMRLLLEYPTWKQALQYLREWNGLLLFDPELQDDLNLSDRLTLGESLRLPAMLVFVAGTSKAITLGERLHLPKSQLAKLKRALDLGQLLNRRAMANQLPTSPSEWCELLENPGLGADVVGLSLTLGHQFSRQLFEWYRYWRLVPGPVTGSDLIAKGWEPGKSLGAEIKRLRYQHIDRHYS